MFDLPKILETPQQPDRKTLNEHYKAIFPNYDWQPHADYLNLAKEMCWFYDDIITNKPARWLSVLGHSGTGKSAWAKNVRNAVKSRNMSVQMWDWGTVCEDYLSRQEYGILTQLRDMPILIIDEIGKTDWKTGNEKLTHLIERRLGKWTILISNKTHGEIAETIDTRIASRMNRDNNRIARISKDCPDYCNFKKQGEDK